LLRALRWFAAAGDRQHAMTDIGNGDVSGMFRRTLKQFGITHRGTRSCTLRTNTTADRFILTCLREWASSEEHRDALAITSGALSRFLNVLDRSVELGRQLQPK
jgi:hypothetical protein